MPSRPRNGLAAHSLAESSGEDLRRSLAHRNSSACTPQNGLIKAKTTCAEGVTIELVVLPKVHASRRMTLRYYWNGARPSEVTERKLRIGQVVEFNQVAALEHAELGIEAYVTEATTLLVLKRKRAEQFVLSLVDA